MAEREQQTKTESMHSAGNPSAYEALRGFEAHAGASKGHDARDMQCLELCPICRAADVLRATAPPELRDQWASAQREALLTLRSLIDHYLERLRTEPERGPRVEDIPIE